jgi:hypothetical protein
MIESQPFIKHLSKAIEDRQKNPVDPNEPSEVDWPKAKPIEKPKPKNSGNQDFDLSA